MEEVFTEFDADEDFDRIAFTSSDGETQLYADCELFDVSESKAIYHVSKTGWTVSSSTDTDIYLYYDNTADHNTTYISKSGGTAAQSVWDSNFKAVYHMADADNARIDVGSAATDRASASVPGYTFVDKNNPANASGKITSVEIYASSNMTGCIVATFTADGDNLTARDSYEIGAVAAGSKQTFSVNLDIESGDYLGIYFESGRIERDNSGEGYWLLLGDYTDCTDTTFGFTADRTMSVYGLSFDIIDSTSNTNHGRKKDVGEPAEATGKVGKGQDFDGTDDYIVISHDNSIADLSNITIESIFYADSYPGTYPYLGAKSGLSGDWSIYRYNSGSKFEFRHEFDTSRGVWRTADISTETWTNYAVSFEVSSSNDPVIYYDGVSQSVDEVTTPSGTPTYSTGDIYIGRRGDSERYFDGIVDETRISSTVRSAAWIAATYSTLYDTLLAYGSEETAPTGEVSNVLFIFSLY